MKKNLIFIGLLGVVAAAALVVKFQWQVDPKCAEIKLNEPLQVNALVEAPQCVSGKVSVEGIVNSVLMEKRSLILIDRSEKDNCEDDCPIRRLPVAWTGTMPNRGDTVSIVGEITKQEKKFILVAKELRAVPEVSHP